MMNRTSVRHCEKFSGIFAETLWQSHVETFYEIASSPEDFNIKKICSAPRKDERLALIKDCAYST